MNVGALALRIGASGLAADAAGADDEETVVAAAFANVVGARFSTVMPTLDGLTKVLRTKPPLPAAAAAGADAVGLGRETNAVAGRLANEGLFSLDTAGAAGAAAEVDDDATEARTPATLMVGASSLDLVTLEETAGLTAAGLKRRPESKDTQKLERNKKVTFLKALSHTRMRRRKSVPDEISRRTNPPAPVEGRAACALVADAATDADADAAPNDGRAALTSDRHACEAVPLTVDGRTAGENRATRDSMAPTDGRETGLLAENEDCDFSLTEPGWKIRKCKTKRTKQSIRHVCEMQHWPCRRVNEPS